MPPHKPQPTGQNSYTFFTFVLVLAATTVLLIAGYFYYLEQKKLNASMLTEVSAVQTQIDAFADSLAQMSRNSEDNASRRQSELKRIDALLTATTQNLQQADAKLEDALRAYAADVKEQLTNANREQAVLLARQGQLDHETFEKFETDLKSARQQLRALNQQLAAITAFLHTADKNIDRRLTGPGSCWGAHCKRASAQRNRGMKTPDALAKTTI